MSVYKSIIKNYLASGFGLGITFLNQIAMVPLFILFWGVEQYADWILITAFSSFFTMTDLGIYTVTVNEFIIKHKQEEYDICRKLLMNNFILTASIAISILLIAGIIALLFGFQNIIQTSIFPGNEVSIVFILLLLQVFMKMYGAAYNSIYRATSKAHRCTMIENTMRISEVCILFAGIYFKLNVILMVYLYCIPSLAGIIFRHIDSKKWFSFSYSYKLFDFTLLKSLLKPALAFLAIPAGQAISNQGLIFIVNGTLGPIILVMFNTTRTLTNFLRALMNVLSWAISPEMSAAYGKKDFRNMRRMYYYSFLITIISSIGCIIFLLFFGKPIYTTWTHHAVEFNSLFFHGMLALLIITCLWNISSVVLSATNNHIEFSLSFLFSCFTGAILVYAGLLIYPNISIIPYILIPVEIALLWFVMHKTNRLLGDSMSTFRKNITTESLYWVKKAKKSFSK